MKIYNTLTKNKEEFVPVNPGRVGMYGCGVTPYKPSHLGHAMQAVIFDVIRRYFEYKGYKVTYVRNFTDIDDKIINAAKKLGIPPLQHSENIIRQCEKDFEDLRVRKADVEPKVSDHIPEIIALIEVLLNKGYAYVTDKGNVYYEVRKFKDYGRLSNQVLEQLQHGVRKEVEADKKDPLDFALWKASEGTERYWDSPWGNGRPGWHIECSAMSIKYLGKHFDIHGGGGDLLFPHHENEIAQSVVANGGTFANYWIHNGLLMVGKEKMSKSLNNDVAIQDWLKLFHPETLRYLILTNHYRSHVQFNPKRYVEANKRVYLTYKLLLEMERATSGIDAEPSLLQELLTEFEVYMDDDFNTVRVLAMQNRLLDESSLAMEKGELPKVRTYLEFIKRVGRVLGIYDLEPKMVIKEIKELELKKANMSNEHVQSLVEKRAGYRQSGDYENADKIRQELLEKGVLVSDEGGVTSWDVAFKEEL